MKSRFLAGKSGISIYSFAKFASQELLLEELVFMKEGNKLYFLERYEDNPFRFKVKVFLTKLFLALVFGVIPVLPFSTYLEIVNLLLNTEVSIENLFFMGGMLFSIYFILQNLNFFIMGMLDATMVISGRIFDWYECLPIPRKKLMKIAYLTLFRSYDLPIIVSILAFPITMLIGSGNWVLFFVSLGVSIVNVVISFSILILLGERINRTIDVNDSGSKKTMFLRLFNVLSYVFILLGSYSLIQWYTNSINSINEFFITSGYRPSINLILCFIPFPFNLSYMVSIFIAPFQASIQLWTSVLIGFSLVCITAYFSSIKSYKAIERATLSEVTQKRRKTKRGTSNKAIQVSIKSRTPFNAYLSRDLAVITRNPKAIISIILPVIVSFIYVLVIGLEIATVINFTNREFFLNWIILSILYPFLSGLIVFGLTHLESSGESITAGLPIVPRDQAKPKIVLMLTVLTCAIMLPSLIYINNPYFGVISINFLTTLPLAWLTLTEIFLLKIRLFGKKRTNMYVMEDYSPKYRVYKWLITIVVPYAIFTSLVLIYLSLFAFRDILSMTTLFWLIPLVGFTYLFLLFNRLLPKYKKKKVMK